MDPSAAAAHLERLCVLLRSYAEPRRVTAAQHDKDSKYTFLAIRVQILRRVATKEFVLEELDAAERLLVHDYVWNNTDLYEVMSIPLLFYRSRGRRIEDAAFATISHWIGRIDNW